MIFETFRQAIQNVWSNKLRTFLTMLGIIIGTNTSLRSKNLRIFEIGFVKCSAIFILRPYLLQKLLLFILT